MKVHLVTTCTNRKKASIPLALCARSLPKAEQSLVQKVWIECISGAIGTIPAVDLYCGRGFSEIKKVSRAICQEFSIISAGLGLVSSTSCIPPYNLTISRKSEDSIQNKIIESKFSASDWWTSINRHNATDNPLSKYILKNKSYLFVLAMSSSYWKLISKDLSTLPKNEFSRIRIIGLTGSCVPPWAQDCLLAYDSRFDGRNSPLPGTRSDFPQRACAHYVTEVLPRCGPQGDKEYVRDLMNGMHAFPNIKRQCLTNEELIELMRKGINGGLSTGAQMLRWLRDVEKVACEQGRCAKLYKLVGWRR